MKFVKDSKTDREVAITKRHIDTLSDAVQNSFEHFYDLVPEVSIRAQILSSEHEILHVTLLRISSRRRVPSWNIQRRFLLDLTVSKF